MHNISRDFKIYSCSSTQARILIARIVRAMVRAKLRWTLSLQLLAVGLATDIAYCTAPPRLGALTCESHDPIDHDDPGRAIDDAHGFKNYAPKLTCSRHPTCCSLTFMGP